MATLSALSPKPILTRDQEETIYYRVKVIKSEVEKTTLEKARNSKTVIDEWEKTTLLNDAKEDFAQRVTKEFENSPHSSYINMLVSSISKEFNSLKGELV